MVNLIFSPYWSPEWFRGIDLVLEVIVLLVTLFITFSSYRIFRVSKEKKFLYFSLAFFFISGAFAVRIGAYALNFLIFVPASQTMAQESVRQIAKISAMRILGTLIPIVLMLASFITLIALHLKLKDKKIISLLFILAFISSFLGAFVNQFWFHFISTILLIYITHYFWCHYQRKKNANTRTVLTAFILFTLSQLLFAVAPFSKISYVAAEIMQLVSFIVLLTGFLIIYRK